MVLRVAVVTGGNKGIGLALVKGLCENFNGDVYLTSRDVIRGENAVKELRKLGLKPLYHQLDIADRNSLKEFHEYIKKRYGGIDVLINNAAIAFKTDSDEPLIVQAEQTIFVNYHGLVSTCEILFPILRPRGRVINVGSAAGHLSFIPGENIRKKFIDKNLTEFKLNKLMNDFVKSVRRGTNEEDGWGSKVYYVSKVGMCALTFIHDQLYRSKGVSINCYHPGYVDTDMTSHKGPMTVEQAAETGLYLALAAPQSLSGKYLWYDGSIVDWSGALPDELYVKPSPPLESLPVQIPVESPPLNTLPADIQVEETIPPVNALPSEIQVDDCVSQVDTQPVDIQVEEIAVPVDIQVGDSISLVGIQDESTPVNSLPAEIQVEDSTPVNTLPGDIQVGDSVLLVDTLPVDIQVEENTPVNTLPAEIQVANIVSPVNSLPAEIQVAPSVNGTAPVLSHEVLNNETSVSKVDKNASSPSGDLIEANVFDNSISSNGNLSANVAVEANTQFTQNQ